MNNYFEINGQLEAKQEKSLILIGVIFLIGTWSLVTALFPMPSLLPSPWKVLLSFGELHFEDALIRNLCYSIKLNFLGYLEAVLISFPIGFVIGLFPIFQGLFSKPVDALRFVPLTAVVGLFIVWFGIEDAMKVHFLAFGILVYLLPVVVQRISEVLPVYQQTVKTLGANKWQMIKSVFIPDVISKTFVDIRVLIAISWTYIIVAELVNKSGGVGAIAYTAARQSRIDKVFAILLVIILVGFLQDLLLKKMEQIIFPWKFMGDTKKKK
jgi:NitT/TauT family transport system permease protein